MTPIAVAGVALALFLVLLSTRLPIGFALAIAGTVGIYLLDGAQVTTATIGSLPFATSAKYTLLVIPLFVFMGVLIAETGIAEEIYSFANRTLRKFPGGLGIATIVATAMLSAVSGSTSATSASIGRVSIREMVRHGYPAGFSAALVAVGGTLAVLIPPSIALVMYGVFTGESIGKLLVAAVVPAVISVLALAGYVVVATLIRSARTRVAGAETESETVSVALSVAEGGRTTVHDGAGSRVPTTPPNWNPPESLPGRTRGFSGLIYIGLLFAVVMGGIYLGVFTATEAGAFGALGALLLGVLHLRKSDGVMRKVGASLRESATTTGMIFGILLGGGVFTVFLSTTRLPQQMTGWVVSLSVPPLLVMVALVIALVLLGMVLDGLSMMVLTVPLTYPVVTALGFDGIWYGIIVVIAFEVGLITPPVGLNVFVLAGLDGAPSAERIFASTIGFVVLQLGIVAVLFAFPGLVTWLPSLMGT